MKGCFYAKRWEKVAIIQYFAVSLQPIFLLRNAYEAIRRISALRREHREGQGLYGHSHPHYIEKVTEQLQKIGFYSNSVINKLQQELAERLGKISGYDDYQLFLINSGAEANENALKLASFTNGRTRVLSCEKAFHGRTSLAVEVTNNPKIIAPINDNSHVTYLPMNDLPAWEAELAKGDVCAVILECIQGVGGIKLATPEFAQGLAAACKKYGTILICDEIQCGYGRSGKFFAHQHHRG